MTTRTGRNTGDQHGPVPNVDAGTGNFITPTTGTRSFLLKKWVRKLTGTGSLYADKSRVKKA